MVTRGDVHVNVPVNGDMGYFHPIECSLDVVAVEMEIVSICCKDREAGPELAEATVS